MQNHKWNGKERLRTPQSESFRKYDRQGERERERERDLTAIRIRTKLGSIFESTC